MAKSHPTSLVWNVGFLLFMLAIGVLSYQLFFKRQEGFSSGSNVEKVVNGNGVLVVTMKNCPHCESMKDDLSALSSSNSNNFAWADSKDSEVSDLNLNSFPSILVFTNGTSKPYNQDRSKSSLQELIDSTKA